MVPSLKEGRPLQQMQAALWYLGLVPVTVMSSTGCVARPDLAKDPSPPT